MSLSFNRYRSVHSQGVASNGRYSVVISSEGVGVQWVVSEANLFFRLRDHQVFRRSVKSPHSKHTSSFQSRIPRLRQAPLRLPLLRERASQLLQIILAAGKCFLGSLQLAQLVGAYPSPPASFSAAVRSPMVSGVVGIHSLRVLNLGFFTFVPCSGCLILAVS